MIMNIIEMLVVGLGIALFGGIGGAILGQLTIWFFNHIILGFFGYWICQIIFRSKP